MSINNIFLELTPCAHAESKDSFYSNLNPGPLALDNYLAPTYVFYSYFAETYFRWISFRADFFCGFPPFFTK